MCNWWSNIVARYLCLAELVCVMVSGLHHPATTTTTTGYKGLTRYWICSCRMSIIVSSSSLPTSAFYPHHQCSASLNTGSGSDTAPVVSVTTSPASGASVKITVNVCEQWEPELWHWPLTHCTTDNITDKVAVETKSSHILVFIGLETVQSSFLDSWLL